MELLLDAGCPIDSRDSGGKTPLLVASMHCLTSVVRLLLSRGAASTVVDYNHNSALHWCLNTYFGFGEYVRLQTIQLLLDAGCPIDLRDSQQRTPLLVAVTHGLLYIVKLLLARGASAVFVDEAGNSALHWSARIHCDTLPERTRLALVQLLLKAGCPIDVRNFQQKTPLLVAAGRGYTSLVRVLLASGADVNAVDKYGDGALHWSLATATGLAEENRVELIQVLLEAGSLSDLPDSRQNTPLLLAAAGGFPAAVRLLLEHGANASSVDDNSDSALHWCIIAGTVVEQGPLITAMQLLLDVGCPVDQRNLQQRTPLILAATRGFTSAVRLLLARGADVTSVDITGSSALHSCIDSSLDIKEETRIEVIQLLLDAGCPIDIQDSQQRTPLFLATVHGLSSVIQLLIARGGNAAAVDTYGDSAHHPMPQLQDVNIVPTTTSALASTITSPCDTGQEGNSATAEMGDHPPAGNEGAVHITLQINDEPIFSQAETATEYNQGAELLVAAGEETVLEQPEPTLPDEITSQSETREYAMNVGTPPIPEQPEPTLPDEITSQSETRKHAMNVGTPPMLEQPEPTLPDETTSQSETREYAMNVGTPPMLEQPEPTLSDEIPRQAGTR
ncbi:hypothetical protein ID866_5005, partial [Astraeus odoratus]